MKKIIMICFTVLSLVFINSCYKTTESNAKEQVISYINDLSSYETKGTMEIVRGDNTALFNLEICYLSPSYYKVSFISNDNLCEQIIVKNDDGVYVLTPSLNKEFKFDSEWPLNSSHAYLLQSIAKDITNDADSTSEIVDNEVIIKAKINHKTNQNLTYMKYYVNKSTLEPTKTVYYDSKDTPLVKVVFATFTKNASLTKDMFNVTKIMENETTSLGEGSTQIVSGSLTQSYNTTASDLILSNTSSDCEVMCFAGTTPFTIVSKTVNSEEPLTPVRIYSDFDITSQGVIAIAENSITYYYGNKEISIISASLSVDEMLSVAASILYVE